MIVAAITAPLGTRGAASEPGDKVVGGPLLVDEWAVESDSSGVRSEEPRMTSETTLEFAEFDELLHPAAAASRRAAPLAASIRRNCMAALSI